MNVQPACGADWQRAASQLAPLADCCRALARALEGRQQQQSLAGAAAEAASAALGSVLSLQAAAAAATIAVRTAIVHARPDPAAVAAQPEGPGTH